VTEYEQKRADMIAALGYDAFALDASKGKAGLSCGPKCPPKADIGLLSERPAVPPCHNPDMKMP
jgi:hypothetical protein